MADNEKAQAARDNLPKIGEMIYVDTAGAIAYESYSQDQKLGRTEQKPYNGVEAAVAADINHPEIAAKVNILLKHQADHRTDAVTADLDKILAGKTLDGLPTVPMVNGKVKMGALFMSDLPTESDVRVQDHGDPQKLNADLAKLAKAEVTLKDAKWLVAEGASNISNAARDMEILINGKTLTDQDKQTINNGLQAERTLEHALVSGTPLLRQDKEKLETSLFNAMGTAASIAGIDTGKDSGTGKDNDPAYAHYRDAMHKGIDDGLEAIKATLHGVAVGPAEMKPSSSQDVSSMHNFHITSTPQDDRTMTAVMRKALAEAGEVKEAHLNGKQLILAFQTEEGLTDPHKVDKGRIDLPTLQTIANERNYLLAEGLIRQDTTEGQEIKATTLNVPVGYTAPRGPTRSS